jgi:ABC-type sugar transport system ATPase subunit
MSHIHIQEVYKTYPGNPPVEALKDIHLDIAPGEFVALLGPSGCGKSTLLNLVASFEPLTSGTLTVGGQPVEAPGPDRGVVFQEAALFPWLSVWENVVFGPKAQGQTVTDHKIAVVGKVSPGNSARKPRCHGRHDGGFPGDTVVGLPDVVASTRQGLGHHQGLFPQDGAAVPSGIRPFACFDDKRVLSGPRLDPRAQVLEAQLGPTPVAVREDGQNPEGQRVLPRGGGLGDEDRLGLQQIRGPGTPILQQPKEDEEPPGR